MTALAFRLCEAADSLKKASTPEPFSTSKTSNWIARSGGLPPYIQHIAHDLMEKRGKSESNAIQMAIGIVRNWASGQGKVDANTRAAASKAVAEFEAKRGKAKAGSLKASLVEAATAPIRPIQLADRATLRSTAGARLRVIEEALGRDAMIALAEAATTSKDWTPELKRTASAGSEQERFEVHHEGQQVGILSARSGYAPGGARPIRWNAKAVNGKMVSDTEDSKQKALDGLRKHLEEGPARVAEHPTSGKWLVAEPEAYGGQVRHTEYPSEPTARYHAGLPEKPSAPERDSKVAKLGETMLFDLSTLQALGEELPAGVPSLEEAGFSAAFDEAKHPRGSHGHWMRVGARVKVVGGPTGDRKPGVLTHTITKIEGDKVTVKTPDNPSLGGGATKVVSASDLAPAKGETVIAAGNRAEIERKATLGRMGFGGPSDKPPGGSDRHGGYKVGDKVSHRQPSVVNGKVEGHGPAQTGEVASLQRNGDLRVRDSKGATVDVHHSKVTRDTGSKGPGSLRRYETPATRAEVHGVLDKLKPGDSMSLGKISKVTILHEGGKYHVKHGGTSLPFKDAKSAAGHALTLHHRALDKHKVKESAPTPAPSVLGSLLEGAAARSE